MPATRIRDDLSPASPCYKRRGWRSDLPGKRGIMSPGATAVGDIDIYASYDASQTRPTRVYMRKTDPEIHLNGRSIAFTI